MKNWIPLLYAVVVFVSCKPEPLDLSVPQAPQQIVVASQLLDSTKLAIVLTRTFNATESKGITLADSSQPFPEELLVANAQVFVESNGIQIQLEEISKGVYATLSLPGLIGNTYTLTVKDVEKGQDIVSQTQMLTKAILDTFSIAKIPDATNTYQLHYAFDDVGPEENWYVVNFYTQDMARDTVPKKPGDLDYIAKRLLEQRLDFDLISDKQMVNGRYSITKQFTSNQLDTFGIALTHISKGYYDFLTAQRKYNSIANKLRGEIIQIPTNVHKGYGYFALQIPDAYFITMDQ